MQEEGKETRAAPPDCQWPESCSSQPCCLTLSGALCGCGETSPYVQALLAVPITSLGHSLDRLPRWLSGKELPANAGNRRDTVSIPGWGRSPGEGNGNPLQYSCLGNPMDRGAWQATIHGVTESDTTEHARTHSCMHAHTHAYPHTHTHTHTHTHPILYSPRILNSF